MRGARRFGVAALGSAAALLLLLFPARIQPSGPFWQAAGGSVHVLLFVGLAWMWGRALPARFRGLVLWGALAALSAGVEWVQPFLGRSTERMDWIYGAAGAAWICGPWRWRWPSLIRWGGVLVLCLYPLAWEWAMIQMEIRAFPALAESEAIWSRRGWALDDIRISRDSLGVFKVEQDSQAEGDPSVRNPGAFRVPACSDWRRMESFQTKLFWPSQAPAIFAIRVDDRPGQPSYAERFQREFTVTQGWNAVHIPVEEMGQTSGGRAMQLEAVRLWGVFLVSDMPFDYFLFGEVRLNLREEQP